ncbi:MAG: hypothetical protein ACRD9R_19435 [Pyrinomonadaceae bacterium]
MILILNAILILLAGAPGSTSWYNYPGFEFWKFINLFVFVGLLAYALRRPLSEAMRVRRETIRRELIRAQEERNAALAKLEEVNARLAGLDAEVAAVREQSQREAAAESERLALSTEEEVRKVREQARREIDMATKAARQDLRRFAAEQSVGLAEEMLRRNIRPEDDARLMSDYIRELEGVGR